MDHEYIAGLSGQAGELSQASTSYTAMNNALTEAAVRVLPGGVDELNASDADCNTCKHLKRLAFDRTVRNPNQSGMPGTCAKDGRSVVAWGNGQFVGASCWESRNSERKSAHAIGGAFDGSQYATQPHWGLK
jgi:hypothetical protein